MKVQLLQKMQKGYKGQIVSERQAARIYDRRAIIAHGMRAKTNFKYTKAEICRIITNYETKNFSDDLDADASSESVISNQRYEQQQFLSLLQTRSNDAKTAISS